MTPEKAYKYAKKNHAKPGFDLEYYQSVLCISPFFAYWFAKNIPGANIEYCQEHACECMYYAYCFANEIPGADIEYCRKACEYDRHSLNEFDKMIAKKALL